MVGQQAAIFAHQETGSENIQLQMRTAAFGIQLHHAFVVEARLAERVHRDKDGLPAKK